MFFIVVVVNRVLIETFLMPVCIVSLFYNLHIYHILLFGCVGVKCAMSILLEERL